MPLLHRNTAAVPKTRPQNSTKSSFAREGLPGNQKKPSAKTLGKVKAAATGLGKDISGGREQWVSINQTNAKKPERSYLQGKYAGNMVEFENTLRLERAELDSCEETRKANHQYRTSHGTYRIKRTQ